MSSNATVFSKFTTREQEFIVAVYECALMRDGVKVDYKEIVEKLGLKNTQAAHSMNCIIKKKLLGTTETEFKGLSPGGKKRSRGDDNTATATPSPNKRNKKVTPSKGLKMEVEDDEEGLSYAKGEEGDDDAAEEGVCGDE